MRFRAFVIAICLAALWPSPAGAQAKAYWLEVPAVTVGFDTLSHVNGGGEFTWIRQRTGQHGEGLSFDLAGDVGFNTKARVAFGIGHGVPLLGTTRDGFWPKVTAEVHGVFEGATDSGYFRGGVGVGAAFHIYEFFRVIGDYVKDDGHWHWRVGVVLVLSLIDE